LCIVSFKESTRDRLLEAAEDVFSSKGYYETPVDEIARRSNTSKGSVYFHFPSKESLFLSVVGHAGDRLMRRVDRAIANIDDPISRVDVALATTLHTLTEHRTLANLLMSKGYGIGGRFFKKRSEILAKFADRVKFLLDQALPQDNAESLNTEVIAYAFIGAISEVVAQSFGTDTNPVDDALPTLRKLFLRGVGLQTYENEHK
jgi:TetR/AcrR family fatty acid metabolism transcriptional regulator